MNNVCSNALGQIAAKSGSHAIYYNYALDGSFLFSVDVTPKDCGYLLKKCIKSNRLTVSYLSYC